MLSNNGNGSMSPPRRFDIGVLIELVKDEPLLYNNRHPDYKDSMLKDAKWERLAKSMNFDEGGKVLCKKWKNVRDRYTKLSKAMKTGRPLDAKNKWKYYDELIFLEKYVEDREKPKWDRPSLPKAESPEEPEVEVPHMKLEEEPETPENVDVDMDEILNHSNGSKFNATVSTTEKLLSLLDSNPISSESELFGRTVAFALERFNNAQRSYIKMKIAELLYKVETDQEGPTAM